MVPYTIRDVNEPEARAAQNQVRIFSDRSTLIPSHLATEGLWTLDFFLFLLTANIISGGGTKRLSQDHSNSQIEQTVYLQLHRFMQDFI